MKSNCILGTGTTLAAAVLWLVPPACGVAWLYGIVGPDARLLYLTAVTLFPAALTLAAPWLRAWLEARSTQRGGEVIERLARRRQRRRAPAVYTFRLNQLFSQAEMELTTKGDSCPTR